MSCFCPPNTHTHTHTMVDVVSVPDSLTFVRFNSSDSFKLQAHLLYYDTQLNSSATALANIAAAFSDAAVKMWAYARSMPTAQQPRSSLIISKSI